MKTFLIKNEASLLDDVKGSNGDTPNLNSRHLVQWAYNIAKGMRYLSRKHIMHGDLAARNILIGRGKFELEYIMLQIMFTQFRYLKLKSQSKYFNYLKIDLLLFHKEIHTLT